MATEPIEASAPPEIVAFKVAVVPEPPTTVTTQAPFVPPDPPAVTLALATVAGMPGLISSCGQPNR